MPRGVQLRGQRVALLDRLLGTRFRVLPGLIGVGPRRVDRGQPRVDRRLHALDGVPGRVQFRDQRLALGDRGPGSRASASCCARSASARAASIAATRAAAAASAPPAA